MRPKSRGIHGLTRREGKIEQKMCLTDANLLTLVETRIICSKEREKGSIKKFKVVSAMVAQAGKLQILNASAFNSSCRASSGNNKRNRIYGYLNIKHHWKRTFSLPSLR